MQKYHKAIVFDMDGVVINSKDYVEEFWLRKLDEHGIHIPEAEQEERFHGRPARPTVNDLFSELTEEARERIIEECAVHDASIETYPMISGVDDFINHCVDKGIRTGLVTSALPGKVEQMLNGLSADHPFEVIITANLVRHGKPDPECYLMAAEKMGVDAEKIIVFEDSVSGVQAASTAGATVIGVNEESLEDTLKGAGAKYVIRDFLDADVETGEEIIDVYPRGKRSQPDIMISSI